VRILALTGAALVLAAASGGYIQALADPSSDAPASPTVTLTPDPAAGASESPTAPGSPAASGSPSPSPSASPAATTLRVGWLGGPEGVGPMTAFSSQARLILHLGYDMLTGSRAEDLGPRPELAESWSQSEDGLTWTFRIRQDATWQDGEPITAADVAFTFNYVIENDISPYATSAAGIKTVEAIDDATVVFTLSEPKADMLSMWVPILPEHLWADVDPSGAEASGSDALPAVGSGPFRVIEYRPGKIVRLRASESYWRGAPAVDEVDFVVYRDAGEMTDDLHDGKLDACVGVPATRFRSLAQSPDLQVIAADGRSFVDVGFTCSPTSKTANPVLRDPAFRQALNWAVDRRAIVKTAFGGFATIGSTLIAPGLRRDPDYHFEPLADQRYGYDLAKAARLLTDAGYLKLAGHRLDADREPITLRLYACESPPEGRRIAQVVARGLRALGIEVDYELLPESSLRIRLGLTLDGLPNPDGDLFISDWVGDPDPSFILSVLTTGQIGSWNDTGWSDEEYDGLFAQQAATLDPAERKSIVDQMQEIAYEESPYMVVAYPQTLEAESTDRWQGWVQVPSGTGSAVASAENIDTYLYVRPKPATIPETAAPWWPWVALPGAALAGAAIVLGGRPLRRRLLKPRRTLTRVPPPAPSRPAGESGGGSPSGG
jgi:peptide/nickel transport system substrate-binding protein